MSLPSGYKQLEYIQSSGTQYINSKFKANQDTRVVIDFEYISGDVVFGAYDAAGANGFGLQAASNKWYTYYGTSNAYSSTAVVANIRLVADVNKNVSTLNGAVLRTATANTFSGANPLIIFGIYNASAPGFLTALKIYSCQIYDNGTLIRDFIPCKNASGVVGMWDDVNSVFYQNAGSGTFTSGPEIKGANKTLIDGTGYDVKAGKCLVGGTAYAIKKGRTLIGGTGYDVKLGGSLTWYLNDTVSYTSSTYFSCAFISNGKRFVAIKGGGGTMNALLYMRSSSDSEAVMFYGNSWGDQAYRTITFDEEPTGDLLAWLEANGTRV